MLDKKQIDFFFNSSTKWVVKQRRQLTATMHFGPGTANKRTAQWLFKKFYIGDDSLEVEKCSGWLSQADNDQLRRSSKTILLVHEKLPKNSKLIILQSFGI